ncbi:MAG: hypothetical protein IJ573_03500 [Clostridia bacterium]|nr:hypothetical protein [Clostridia bacterium]
MTRSLDRMDDGLRDLLKRQTGLAARLVLLVLSAFVFYLFACRARYAMIDEIYSGDPVPLQQLTARVYTAIFALSLAMQLRLFKKLPLYGLILAAVITGCVLLAKISLLDYQSDDYQIFLSNWIYNYSRYGIREGLGRYLESDYTPPYLYLLQIISRVRDYPWQYLVKAWSVAFEVLLCTAVCKLASLQLKRDGALLVIWHITSMLPTVVFNGAYWGQCDAIYVSICLTALYLGMERRSAGSLFLFGVALSFKLQTVFFLPVMLPLWLRRDLKLRYLPLIPAAYMFMMIPALWGGKSLHHVLTCYLQQAGQYNFMTMNGTNIWQLLPSALPADTKFQFFSTMAMLMAFAVLMAMCAFVCLHREHLSGRSVVLFALLSLSAIPYFLPKMHERYTFGADVLSVVAAAYCPKLFVLPLLFGFASYICYTGGLPGGALVELRYAALLQGAAVLITAAALAKSVSEDEKIREVKG